MSTSNRMKKALLMSSTMPPGTGGSDASWLMGGAAHQASHDHDHVHGPNCNHEAHSEAPKDAKEETHVHGSGCCDHDDEDDVTSPRGGCC